MTDQHSDCKNSEARFRRIGSPLFSRRRTMRRRGQTMVEYTLILAYITIVSLQALQNLSFITLKTYNYTNCSLIVGNMQGMSPDPIMAAIDLYLADPSHWQRGDINQVSAAISDIHDHFHVILYGS